MSADDGEQDDDERDDERPAKRRRQDGRDRGQDAEDDQEEELSNPRRQPSPEGEQRWSDAPGFSRTWRPRGHASRVDGSSAGTVVAAPGDHAENSTILDRMFDSVIFNEAG